MPLRDHFRPPVSRRANWEALHGMWPAEIVRQLRDRLPDNYAAAPTVHLGSQIEVDVATYQNDDAPRLHGSTNGGAPTAVWAPPEPTVAVEVDIPDYDEYSVQIYNIEHDRELVATIELVSPANKDRPLSRNAFVGKCAALLQKGVAVSIVDLVIPRQFNLYAELLQFLGQSDPSMGEPLAASLRRFVPMAAPGQADASANLVAHAHPGATAPHAAAVADRATRCAAGSGAKLRTGVPRFADHVRGEEGEPRGASSFSSPMSYRDFAYSLLRACIASLNDCRAGSSGAAVSGTFLNTSASPPVAVATASSA